MKRLLLAILILLSALLSACAAPAPTQLAQVVQPTQPLQNCGTPVPLHASTIKECWDATATPVPTATGTATATSSPTDSPTATSAPSVTAAPTLTTTTGPVVGMQPVPVDILGTCTAEIHDRYTVTVNGIRYRTWHPQVVPIDPAAPEAGSCAFAHEHGQNPDLSLANPNPPAFEQVALAAGISEPHEGYKVLVANLGDVNKNTWTANTSTRMTVHMGTGGVGRFDARFHSFTFDLLSPDGHQVHVQGLGDTGAVGDICQRDAASANALLPRIGRSVMFLPGTDPACPVTSVYEIWAFAFSVHDTTGNPVVTVNGMSAVNDPITLLNPVELPGHRVPYYTTNYFANGPMFGCALGAYFGPVYWYNAAGPTSYRTDAYGLITPGGALTQTVSAHTDLGIRMSSGNFSQFSTPPQTCPAGGLGLKN